MDHYSHEDLASKFAPQEPSTISEPMVFLTVATTTFFVCFLTAQTALYASEEAFAFLSVVVAVLVIRLATIPWIMFSYLTEIED